MNAWGAEGRPFIFMVDFGCTAFFAAPLDRLEGMPLRFSIGQTSHGPITTTGNDPILISAQPIPYEDYLRRFLHVRQHIGHGDTYLCNLTCETPIRLSHSLEEVYARSRAPYRLLVGDQMLVFSPETFVQVQDGRIHAHPMKGTIDASIPGAAQRILDDPKETAEHYTIVDLLRNDLSIIASDVRVERFRYIQEVVARGHRLLQVSSEISGKLPWDYPSRIGEILMSLLPAGSVSGAPKERTLQIIRETEGYERGFYTGIIGVSDGRSLDSGVMIRFIERTANGLVFRSGGGITWDSDPESEYQEMIDKIYVPAL
ncbi:MAG: aminodeoxychorismate synthase component I [Bacteroidales bacterium]|nr:aminodeoxychorismate synthase component I [Bacteroidales bacterium]